MTDDLKRMLATVFKMGKGGALTRTEMTNIMIYNLRWFDPEGAKLVIQAGFSSGYLKNTGDGGVLPEFDIGSVTTEAGWEPAPDLDLKKMVRPLMERLIDAVVDSGLEKKDAVRSINRKSEELNLLFAAGVIYVGLEHGADMSRFYGEVENFILHGDR
ncbi:MAG: DUF2240 family protein [Thermoplasmatota archaeon]